MKMTMCALLLCAGAAAGRERFGERGTIAPSGSIGASYAATPTNLGDITTYGFSIDPGAMFFVADEVAIGGFGHVSYASSGDPLSSGRSRAIGYGLAPSVGWNLWLGERVSFFPQATLQFSWVRTSFSGAGSAQTDRLITAQLFLPALVHVTTHFFLGLGPSISRDVDSTFRLGIGSQTGATVVDPVKTTTVGIRSVIGGWF